MKRRSRVLASLLGLALAAALAMGKACGHSGVGTGGDAGVIGSGGLAGSRVATGTGGFTGSGGTSLAGGSAGSAGARGGIGGTGGTWRPFDATSPWNTSIAPGAALDPNSAALITDFSTIPGQTTFWVNIQNYSVPVYFVDSRATPMVSVAATVGGTGFRTGAGNDSVTAGTGMAPIPVGAMPAAGTDRHLAIIDRATNREWGFWNANLTAGGWTAGLAATMDLSGVGVRPPERNAPWWAGHGPRACGYSLIAGLVTVDEIRAGRIDHALVVAYPHIRSRYYTPPASTAQATTTEALPTRGIPCGGRIQLDPALDVATLGLSAAGVTLARALQEFGAYVGDYAGAVSLYVDSSTQAQAVWSGGVLDNGVAARIPLGRFRVLTIGTTFDNMN